MVRERGLEPPRPKAQPPQGCVYTSFTTRANICILTSYYRDLKPDPNINMLRIFLLPNQQFSGIVLCLEHKCPRRRVAECPFYFYYFYFACCTF